MKIIYYDGSILRCSTIEMSEKKMIADGVYTVPLVEVLRIEDDE